MPDSPEPTRATPADAPDRRLQEAALARLRELLDGNGIAGSRITARAAEVARPTVTVRLRGRLIAILDDGKPVAGPLPDDAHQVAGPELGRTIADRLVERWRETAAAGSVLASALDDAPAPDRTEDPVDVPVSGILDSLYIRRSHAKCRGTGEVGCHRCFDGKHACPCGDGTKRRWTYSPIFNGWYEEQEACDLCDGTGRIEHCDTCKGAQRVTCAGCAGSGLETVRHDVSALLRIRAEVDLPETMPAEIRGYLSGLGPAGLIRALGMTETDRAPDGLCRTLAAQAPCMTLELKLADHGSARVVLLGAEPPEPLDPPFLLDRLLASAHDALAETPPRDRPARVRDIPVLRDLELRATGRAAVSPEAFSRRWGGLISPGFVRALARLLEAPEPGLLARLARRVVSWIGA